MEKETIDLKPEQESEATGQAETTVEETDSSDAVKVLEERLKKAEEERENYKQALLSKKKAFNRTLEAKPEETEEEQEQEKPEWDEDSQRFQKQTLSQAEKVAKKAAKEAIEGINEKEAIGAFLESYPEFEDATEWKEILGNYNPKHGKGSVKSIITDLERARVLRLHDKGEISRLAEEAETRGKRQGYAERALADLTTTGGERTKTVGSKGGEVTEGARRLAERFRIDPKKLAKEDDSRQATIKF